tara:strand:+ start:3467 stop:4027 length:561 start_codon:yes stop_codon:yes gene_type:complete
MAAEEENEGNKDESFFAQMVGSTEAEEKPAARATRRRAPPEESPDETYKRVVADAEQGSYTKEHEEGQRLQAKKDAEARKVGEANIESRRLYKALAESRKGLFPQLITPSPAGTRRSIQDYRAMSKIAGGDEGAEQAVADRVAARERERERWGQVKNVGRQAARIPGAALSGASKAVRELLAQGKK